ADSLTLSATGRDHVFTSTVAAGGGLGVGIAGAQSTSHSDQATLARVGANASVMAQTVSLISDHSQEVDAKADAYAFGLAAGAGASVMALGSHADPSLLRISAVNEINATDHVEVESISGFSITAAKSSLVSHSLAAINVSGAKVENSAGDVNFSTKTDTYLTP